MCHRLMRYLKGTLDCGVVMYGSKNDLDHIAVGTEVDSDHANDPFSAKSSSSHHTVIIGRNTFQRPRQEALALLSEIIGIYKGT